MSLAYEWKISDGKISFRWKNRIFQKIRIETYNNFPYYSNQNSEYFMRKSHNKIFSYIVVAYIRFLILSFLCRPGNREVQG